MRIRHGAYSCEYESKKREDIVAMDSHREKKKDSKFEVGSLRGPMLLTNRKTSQNACLSFG